ncbi:MAG: hypothetical protein C0601_01005 [Candidatus Muiribacterium halophilum]|uniref:ABC3 transporter permease protein domain-containing protein n=1 Tax=Muiribacterium halophilum TaxID=2053465 RepID=A0A2N5ZMB9_MUIH1|nr:MAG: hypothetical protein C0601_01005 [Candidatus Muirbacterium halophilum]
MNDKLIYKMIFKEHKGVFFTFLLMTSVFIITSFLIFFLLNGYQEFVLKNMLFGNFHLNVKKENGFLFSKYEKNIIEKQIKEILPESECVFYSSSQALLKNGSKYTGTVVYSFDSKNISNNVFKKIKIDELKKDGIIIGKGIAELLGLKKNDKVIVNGLEEKVALKVDHIFNTGIYDVDYSTVFIDSEKFSILNILPIGSSDCGIFLEDSSKISLSLKKLKEFFKKNYKISFKITDIYEDNSLFQGAINMEKLITTIISNVLMLMFFFVIGLFTLSRLNTFRREFSYIIVSGIKIKDISFSVWKIMLKGFFFIFIASTFISYILCMALDGNVPIPEEIYYVDSPYFVFDYHYVFVYMITFSLFTIILKIITDRYFYSLKPDEELRSN